MAEVTQLSENCRIQSEYGHVNGIDKIQQNRRLVCNFQSTGSFKMCRPSCTSRGDTYTLFSLCYNVGNYKTIMVQALLFNGKLGGSGLFNKLTSGCLKVWSWGLVIGIANSINVFDAKLKFLLLSSLSGECLDISLMYCVLLV